MLPHTARETAMWTSTYKAIFLDPPVKKKNKKIYQIIISLHQDGEIVKIENSAAVDACLAR